MVLVTASSSAMSRDFGEINGLLGWYIVTPTRPGGVLRTPESTGCSSVLERGQRGGKPYKARSPGGMRRIPLSTGFSVGSDIV
jgi:hypothetical protein